MLLKNKALLLIFGMLLIYMTLLRFAGVDEEKPEAGAAATAAVGQSHWRGGLSGKWAGCSGCVWAGGWGPRTRSHVRARINTWAGFPAWPGKPTQTHGLPPTSSDDLGAVLRHRRTPLRKPPLVCVPFNSVRCARLFVDLLLFPARLYNRAGNKRAMTLFSSWGCRYAEETCGPRQPESLAPIVPLLEILHRDKLETLGHVEALGWPRGPTKMGHLHRCPVSLHPGAGA